MRNNNTLLIAGAAAVALYFLTRPKVQTYPPAYSPYGAPAYSPYPTGYNYGGMQQGNPIAQDLTASKSALEGLSDLISNFF